MTVSCLLRGFMVGAEGVARISVCSGGVTVVRVRTEVFSAHESPMIRVWIIGTHAIPAADQTRCQRHCLRLIPIREDNRFPSQEELVSERRSDATETNNCYSHFFSFPI